MLPHRNRGLSLIELLVAMVISLFLVGGMIELFIQNKTSYKLQEGIARAQENGRLAIHFLEKNIRRAGHPWDGMGSLVGFKENKVPSSTLTRETPWEGDASMDELVMQYKAPSEGAIDCTGRAIDANDYVAMHFYVGDIADGKGTLYCQSVTTASSTILTTPLIEDVMDLQFTYGVDSSAPIDGIPDGAYLDADNVAANNWDDVVTVHVEARISVEPTELSNNSTMFFSTTIPVRNQIDVGF